MAAALTCMAVNVAVYGFVAWLPTFLVGQGMSVVRSLGFTTLMSLGSVAGALVGMALGDRVSRQRSLVGTCLAIMALGSVYAALREPIAITVVGFSLVTSIYTLVTLGLYAYIPELFPTHLRLRGTGFAGMCGRATSIATPFLVVALFDRFGLPGCSAWSPACWCCSAQRSCCCGSRPPASRSTRPMSSPLPRRPPPACAAPPEMSQEG